MEKGASSVIVRFQEQASGLRLEWSMIDPGRANGVGVVAKLLAALSVRIVADDQIAGEQKNLFPVIVHERCSRERAGVDAQQARAVAAFVVFVECAGDDFLFEAWRIAGRNQP